MPPRQQPLSTPGVYKHSSISDSRNDHSSFYATNVATDRQRDTMIKAKKDCHFEYSLSYKPVSRGSSEKQYIGTLKCLGHTHRINLKPVLIQGARDWHYRVSGAYSTGAEISYWKAVILRRSAATRARKARYDYQPEDLL